MSTKPPHSTQIVVELCAETAAACAAATVGGAHRIELCTDLGVGGLTPSPQLVEAALACTSLPVHLLLRPTAETFVYSPSVFRALRVSLLSYKSAGIAGFVLGLLTPSRTVDVEHTRALVELAHPLPVTFHRAFDEVLDRERALDLVIAAGCTRVLTSGGAPDVVQGAPALASLVRQAGDRIAIAAGGGVRLANAASIARQTRAPHFHASLREPEPIGQHAHTTLAERTQELIRLLTHRPSEEASHYTTAGTGIDVPASRAGR